MIVYEMTSTKPSPNPTKPNQPLVDISLVV